MNPILQKRRFTVLHNTQLATDTFELTLAPEQAADMFPFLAGQWVYLYLLNEDGSEWGRAAFSLASAPSESTTQIQLAIKKHGDFTTRASTLREGDAVLIQGPFGVFTLKPESQSIVLCAGGIGVAPFRSMIREAIAKKDSRPITLVYSNSTRDAAAYLKEMTELSAAHPQIRFIPVYTRETIEGAQNRRFDHAMLKECVPDCATADYLMCGPDAFMDTVKEVLVAEGLDPKQKLRKELFH